MEKSKEDVLEVYKCICRESGATQEVGPSYYEWFISLSDQHVLSLLELIVRDRADEINRWAFEEPRMKTDQDIYDYLETLLLVLGYGLLTVNSDGSIGCCAPEGPEPTAAEAAEIDYKTRAARPLYPRAVLNVLKGKFR